MTIPRESQGTRCRSSTCAAWIFSSSGRARSSINAPARALLSLLALLPVAAATLKEAIEQVERETGGKVLSADTIRTRGTVVYRIKVLMPDGRVRVFQIPA